MKKNVTPLVAMGLLLCGIFILHESVQAERDPDSNADRDRPSSADKEKPSSSDKGVDRDKASSKDISEKSGRSEAVSEKAVRDYMREMDKEARERSDRYHAEKAAREGRDFSFKEKYIAPKGFQLPKDKSPAPKSKWDKAVGWFNDHKYNAGPGAKGLSTKGKNSSGVGLGGFINTDGGVGGGIGITINEGGTGTRNQEHTPLTSNLEVRKTPGNSWSTRRKI
jgi:hypothetical protein